MTRLYPNPHSLTDILAGISSLRVLWGSALRQLVAARGSDLQPNGYGLCSANTCCLLERAPQESGQFVRRDDLVKCGGRVSY